MRQAIQRCARGLALTLRDHPAYALYPKYATVIAGACWFLGQTPAPRDFVYIIQSHPWLLMMWEVFFLGGALLALVLGSIGMFRNGRADKLLSIGAVIVSYWLLEKYGMLTYETGSILAFPLFVIVLLLWELPPMLLHEAFAGQPVPMLLTWIAYLVGLYVLLRFAARRFWRRNRDHILRMWHSFRDRFTPTAPPSRG